MIDSATESPEINSKQIPDLFRNTEKSIIYLITAFKEQITNALITFPKALKLRESNCLYNSVDVLFAVTGKLF